MGFSVCNLSRMNPLTTRMLCFRELYSLHLLFSSSPDLGLTLFLKSFDGQGFVLCLVLGLLLRLIQLELSDAFKLRFTLFMKNFLLFLDFFCIL